MEQAVRPAVPPTVLRGEAGVCSPLGLERQTLALSSHPCAGAEPRRKGE